MLARNFLSDPKWISGTIIGQQGPLSYLVQIRGGRRWRRHADQLLATGDSPQKGSNSVAEYASVPPSPISLPVSNSVPQPTSESTPSSLHPDPVSEPSQDVLPSSLEPKTMSPSKHATPVAASPRYPKRHRRPPVRYSPESFH